VGSTGPKTKAAIEEAKSGILFVDEAYRLSQGGGKDFGREAIEELMAVMNEPPGKAPVMVFAGYNKDMEKFLRSNEGLYRRFQFTFDFEDYKPEELAKITEIMVESAGFELDDSLLRNDRAELTAIITENTTDRHRALMNGGLCERIFSGAKSNLDGRSESTTEISLTMSRTDVLAACVALPPPPEPEGGDGGGSLDGMVPLEKLTEEQERTETYRGRVNELEKDLERVKGQLVARSPETAAALAATAKAEEKLGILERELAKIKLEKVSLEKQLKEAGPVVGNTSSGMLNVSGPENPQNQDMSIVPELLPHPPTFNACCCLVTKPCISYSVEASIHATVVCCIASYDATVYLCTNLYACCQELYTQCTKKEDGPATVRPGAAAVEPQDEHISEVRPAGVGERSAQGDT